MAEPIASKLIGSLVCYLNMRRDTRPFKTYGSIRLTDACLHVAAIVKSDRLSGITKSKGLELVSNAQLCLWQLEQNLGVGSNAVKCVEGIFRDICTVPTSMPSSENGFA